MKYRSFGSTVSRAIAAGASGWVLLRHGKVRKIVVTVRCAVVLAVVSSFGCQTPARNGPVEAIVVSFNIRYDNPGDGIDAWPHRRDRVAGLIKFHGADVAGLQEALRHQIDDLVQQLPEYRWYGVGRDDGESEGEFVPIFYRQDRFAAIDSGTFWLSDMPDVPASVGWDAALTRITSWLRLRELDTGKTFIVYNAHFDHVGETARTESARLVKSVVVGRMPADPAIVMGDFNSVPESEAYSLLTGDWTLTDAAALAPLVYGPESTFHGFTVEGSSPRRIDYVFVTPGIRVTRLGVLTDQQRGHYPSDHLPVLADLRIP